MGNHILPPTWETVFVPVGRSLHMPREVLFFTEMGYTAYPQDQARKLGYNNLMFPN